MKMNLLVIFVAFVVLEDTPIQALVPVIDNVAVPINLNEDVVTEQLLDTFVVYDPDGKDVTSCDVTGHSGEFYVVQDVTNNTLFDLFVISGAGLEYDTTPVYNLAITCEDEDLETVSDTIIVNILPNQPPTIVPQSVPANVGEHEQSQRIIYTIDVSDAENDSFSCQMTDIVPNSNDFGLWRATTDFDVYLLSGASLDYTVDTSYTITVRCNDSSGSSTDDIIIDVIPNSPPTIVPQSVPANVGENEQSQRIIYTIDVSDAENDSISCQMTDIVPNSYDFGLWRATTDFDVYLLSGASLDYTVDTSYTITVRCNDSSGSSTDDIIIDVIPNSPPTFDNLPGPNIVVDASTILGDSIFTASASDNDSSSLTFTLVSSPSTPELFAIDSVIGEVTATKDLEYAVRSAYSLAITVSDGQESTTEELIVDLTNVNNAPIINNLDDTINFDEDTGANTVLFTVDKYDADGDTTYLTYTVSPVQYTTTLYLNNNNILKLSSDQFDYEKCSKFVVTFYVSDGKAEMGPYYLNIDVNDVAEACVFTNLQHYITMAEGNSGTGTTDPGFYVTDDDVGDSFSYSIDQTYSTESTYFAIDPTSGEISFGLNYDIDTSHPTNATLIVVCTDTYGETGTTTVEVEVTDVNDNVPTFTEVGYLNYIDQTDGPATTVRLMNQYNTDIDSGLNAEVEYTWTAVTSGSNNYFHMTSKGIVLLSVYAKDYMTYGDIHRFIVTATDKGTPPLSSTAILDIMYRYWNYTYTTTTVVTTTEESSFWDNPANIAAVVLGSLLGLLLLGLLAYLLAKYCCKNPGKFRFRNCCKNCCKRTQKVKPSTKPKPDKKPFDFWNRKNDELLPGQRKGGGGIGNSQIGGVTRYEGMPPPN